MRFDDKICLRPRDKRERSIDNLHKITRGLQGSLKNSHQKINPLKMGSHPLFIERRRNSQISSRSGLEIVLTRLSVDRPIDRSKCVVDRSVDRAKSYKTTELTENIGQPAGRPTN